jgi:putative transposase
VKLLWPTHPFIPTMIGFLYLAVVLDDWSRRIVGWAFSTDLKTRVVRSAIAARRLAFDHRPVQLATLATMRTCESFFATLECELLDRHRFRSHGEARMAVIRFVEGFYNPSRRHPALGYSRRSNTKGDAMV